MQWLDDLRARFDGRAELPPPALAAAFGVADERLGELGACLGVFHEEYGILPGRLRPDDSLAPFTDDPRAPAWAWIWVRAAYEDRLSELNHRLACARRRLGVPAHAGEVRTVGDYVGAWMGETVEARAG